MEKWYFRIYCVGMLVFDVATEVEKGVTFKEIRGKYKQSSNGEYIECLDTDDIITYIKKSDIIAYQILDI